MRFSAKRVLVTGAGAGTGRATAEAFAAEVAWVCAVDSNQNALSGLQSATGSIRTEVLDVTDQDAVGALAVSTGQLDILFNCAGLVTSGTILETSRQDWDRSYAVNVTAVFEVTKAFLPAMLEQGSGVILNMASDAASFVTGQAIAIDGGISI